MTFTGLRPNHTMDAKVKRQVSSGVVRGPSANQRMKPAIPPGCRLSTSFSGFLARQPCTESELPVPREAAA